MSFEELVNEIQNGKFKPEPELVKSFIDQVSIILDEDVGHLIEVINSMGGLMLDHDTVGPLVNKSSPVGKCFILEMSMSWVHCLSKSSMKKRDPSAETVY